MNKPTFFLTLAVIFTLVIAGYAQMDHHGMEKMATGEQKQMTEASDSYPLDYCIISGQQLGAMGDPVVYDHNGREIRFCCQACVGTFEEDSENFLKKMDEAIIKVQKDSYPYTTCPISGKVLGGMGEPVNYVYNNQLVRFCCAGCIEAFEEDPEKHLQKLAATESPEMEMHHKTTEDHSGHNH